MKNTQFSFTSKYKISNKLLLVLIVILMIPVFFVSKALFTTIAQTNEKKEKKITKEPFKNEPIEFLELKSDEKQFKLNEKLSVENDDWLKDFTIKFKNISNKPITYVDILLDFPETATTDPGMAMPIYYGVHPRARQNGNSNENKLLQPGEIGEISLSPERLTKLKKFISPKYSLVDLTELHLRIMVVYFEDGTQWSAGSMFRPDPNRIGNYIPIDKNQEEKK